MLLFSGMNLQHFIKNPTCRGALLFACTASTCILALALIGQYGFKLYPCHLCLYQRYPYATIILLSLAGAYLTRSPRAHLYLALLCGVLFVADAGIATYHAGVEQGIFPGPSGCTNLSAGDAQTVEQMLAAIKKAPLVTCDQPMLTVLGLSMAAWNAVAASLCALATFLIIFHARKATP